MTTLSNVSPDEFRAGFLISLTLVILAIIFNMYNRYDLSAGYVVTEKAYIQDRDFVGRNATPTMVIEIRNEHFKVYFEDANQLYSCAEIGTEMTVELLFGKSNKLRGIDINCSWGKHSYREFMHLEIKE